MFRPDLWSYIDWAKEGRRRSVKISFERGEGLKVFVHDYSLKTGIYAIYENDGTYIPAHEINLEEEKMQEDRQRYETLKKRFEEDE